MLRMLLGTGPLPPPGKGGRGRRGGGGAFLEPTLFVNVIVFFCGGADSYPQGRDSPVAVHLVVDVPVVRARRLFGYGTCRAGLLITLHLAGCSFDCPPFVADNVGSRRLILLLTKHLTLYSLFSSSMAGMDEKDSHAVHPCRGAEADSHGLLFRRP